MSEFHISVPTEVLINDLAIIASMVIIGLVIWFYSEETNRVVGAGVLGVVIIIFIYMSLIAPAQTKVVLDDDILIVNIPPYGHEIVKKEEIWRIYMVDIEYDKNLRPKSKKFGEGTRSYKKGWYKLVNGRDAIIMTTGTKVVCLELDDKYITHFSVMH
ncbi:MAG: PH domain-containing protein [Euryarchaeota archaeon]|nr:PH domain-containing protein [Euryarchaeota archaeon]